MKATAHLMVIWMTAACVLVQSISVAAGGFLCIGCPNTATGVALAPAPCNAIDACCASDTIAPSQTCPDACPDHDQHSQPDNCGCVDILLPPSAGMFVVPPVKIILTFVAFADPIPALLSCDAGAQIKQWRAWTVRGGPPSVRLLAPDSRRTVLVI